MRNDSLEIVNPQQDQIGTCSSFLFDGHDVRIVLQEENDFIFNANDVCGVLEYSNPRDALIRHVDEEDVVFHDTLTKGGNQKQKYVKEPGLYALIYGSKQKEAKKFKKWINGVVLPSIRKTGSYSVDKKIPAPKSIAEDMKTCLQIAKPYHTLAKLLGCSKSTAASLTAQFVKRSMGMDISDLLIENKATVQDPLVNPSDLAPDLGYTKGNVGNKVNVLLQKIGFQDHVEYKSSNGKMKKRWELKEPGKEFAQLFDTGAKHSDGLPRQQIKWYKNKTLDFIKSHSQT